MPRRGLSDPAASGDAADPGAWGFLYRGLDGYLFSGKWKSGKARPVKSRLAADFIGWKTDNDKFETAFKALENALKTDDKGRNPPPKPKL